MSRKSRTNLTAVEKLIEQRRLFQEWLTKLDQGIDGMPGHVVERVRNDYRARLTEVTGELAEHEDAVRQALADAQAHHDGLEAEQTARKDELAELRLRRHVGEVDDARFKETNARLKTTLDEMGKELTAALRDIERFEEILDLIAATPHRAAAPVETPEAAEAEAAGAAEAATAIEEKPAEEAEEPVEEPVSAPVAEAAPAKAPASEPAAARRPPAPRPSQIAADEMEFLRALTGAARGGKASSPSAGASPAAPKPAPAARPAATAPVETAPEDEPFVIMESGAPSVPGDPPAAAPERTSRPRAAEAARSGGEGSRLMCGECGAANLPTEWYCEKCGAELSAL
jgi:hypothetical protein